MSMTDESVQMDIMEHKERRSITQAPGETYITNLDAVSVADPSHVPDEIKAMLKNMDADPYSEDEAELRFLLSKPTCFIILGKPGVGKSTLARRLAQEWKCVLINSTDILVENMELQTDMGQRCAEMLTRGEAVPENIVIQLIKEKIDSPEVAHHGYILDDFPCMSEATLTIHDQLELVKSWKLKPDFIINIRLPDKDLERRRLGQKIDPVTGDIYTREVYAPEKPVKPITNKEGEEEEEEEEDHAEEEELEEEEGLAELPVEVLERLIRRPQDVQQQVEKDMTCFKENMLRLIEDYMADHNQQYLVELDGNQPLDILLKQVIQKLNCFVVRPAATLIPLQGEEEEEMPEDIDTDELMRSLTSRKMVAPRFRWRRSRWLRYCPVALSEGSKVLGKPDHAVSFLDKMYCLSSPEAMEKFIRNPRPYLLPPQPRPPCKIIVLGPPISGKSTICALLAQKYNAKVLKVEEIIKPRLKEEKEKLLHQVKTETTEAAIQAIKTKVKEQLEAEMQRKEEAARLAAEAAAREAEERAAVTAAKEKEEQEEGSKIKVKDIVKTDTIEEESLEPEELVPPSENDEPVLPPEPTEPVPPSEPEEPVPPSEPEEPVPPSEPEVDDTHPEVVGIVTAAVAEAEKQEITLSAEVIVELMEAAIADAEHKMRNEQPSGPLKGGWILDNFPSTREQWNVCIEKNLLPDDVIVLSDTSENGTFLTTRYYTVNREYIDGKIQERLMLAEMEKQRIAEEKQHQEEEERRIAEELRKAEEEAKRAEEEAKRAEEEAKRAEEEAKRAVEEPNQEEEDDRQFNEERNHDGQDDEDESAKVKENIEEKAEEKIEEVEMKTDVTHMEKIQESSLEMETTVDVSDYQDTDKVKIPEGPEMELYYKQRQEYDKEFENVNGIISGGTSLEPLVTNISSRSLEEILEEITQGIEKGLIYHGWVYSSADQEEEDEDMEATAAEEEEEAESEAEDTEEVNPNRNPKKPLGESSFFCPVTLKETDVLFPGDPENAVRYREKLYYFSSSDTRDQFLQNPENYISKDKPLQPPPLRLVILGPRGSGKTLHGRYLAEKLGLFHIAFTERLQELIIAKTKKKIGPQYEEEGAKENEEEEVESDEEDVKEKMEEDENKSVKFSPDALEGTTEATAEEAEVELTEMEEAIKTSLETNDSLASEFLEAIVPQWWRKEPFKSTGFILEEFPRSPEEARFLSENGLFPDAAIILNVSDVDVIGRLLPPKMDIWRVKRDKLLEKKKRKKDKAKKKRDAAIQKRREELLKEREARQAERAAEKAANREGDSDDEVEDAAADEEEEENEEEEDIEAILAEEFEPEAEEEEEEEELEPDAMERMRNELTEAYEDQNSKVESVQETLAELLIPKLIIEAGRKNHIVRYILNKKLKPYVEFRRSLLERVYPISEQLAQQMIRTGYKQPSRFGRWCPVKLHEGDCIQPMNGPGYPSYPCIYRQHIYYLSSKLARDTFVADPLTYLKQPSPKPVVPIRIAIIGPPKSGKTTLSNRFVEEYGIVRLSVGEAMRRVLQTQPKSELAQLMNQCLYRGQVVPEELQVQALEVCLLDMHCQTRGYVLDGYPITKKQVDLMNQRSIIPVRVIELEMNNNEVMVRGTKDRLSPARIYPMHDSAQILHKKLMAFKNAEEEVHDWYENEHMNIVKIDALQSKWMIWNRALEIVQAAVIQIQTYLQRIDQGKAASIADMCIRPTEFQQRVGDFGQYCPVSLALYGQLIDCATKRELTYAAEFRGHYYKMKGKKELDQFLADAEAYVPPRAPRKLPPPELLPKRRRPEEVNALREMELQGYCPVTFLDGKCMYESIVPGDPNLIVEYQNKFYCLESEEKLLKFMSLPEKYWDLKLPHKLPPHKQPMPLSGLPMLGYMEQGVATALIAALTAAGNFKPKYPFISSTRSALLYVAYHLKAFNPKSSNYMHKKYKQKLRQFEENCNLIRYLGNNMTVRYRDPSERPADFDSKMEVFFALKGTEPTPTWIT